MGLFNRKSQPGDSYSVSKGREYAKAKRQGNKKRMVQIIDEIYAAGGSFEVAHRGFTAERDR